MTRRFVCVLAIGLLGGCGGGEAPQQTAAQKEPAPVAKPPDQSRRFPSTNQVKIEIVDNHLLGKDFLPGGNLAEYEREGKKYQQFLITAKTPDQATFMMMDFKAQLSGAKFLGHFGGYFGLDGETPVLLFPLNNYLAGVVGLPQDEADLVARDFAARLR
jgi:hypothetical protein